MQMTTIIMTTFITMIFIITAFLTTLIGFPTLKPNHAIEAFGTPSWKLLYPTTPRDIDHLLHWVSTGGVLDFMDPGEIGRMAATSSGEDCIEPLELLLPPGAILLLHPAETHPATHRLDHRMDYRIGEMDALVIAVALECRYDIQPRGCGLVSMPRLQELQKLDGLWKKLRPPDQLVKGLDAGFIRKGLQNAPVNVEQEPGDLSVMNLPENGHQLPETIFILHGGDLQFRIVRRLRAVTSDTTPSRGDGTISSSQPRAPSHVAG